MCHPAVINLSCMFSLLKLIRSEFFIFLKSQVCSELPIIYIKLFITYIVLFAANDLLTQYNFFFLEFRDQVANVKKRIAWLTTCNKQSHWHELPREGSPDFVYCWLLVCVSEITSSDKQTVWHSSINESSGKSTF